MFTKIKCTAFALAFACIPSVSFAQTQSQWIDLTSEYIVNPGFDTNDEGWTSEAYANSVNVSYSCKEFWDGIFNFYQTTEVPNGKYRLSVQGYYRMTNFSWSGYQTWADGTEEIPVKIYANNDSVRMASVYSYHFDSYVNGATYISEGGGWGQWGGQSTGYYFPNTMESAQTAFTNGAYQNSLEFNVTDGNLTFGIENWTYDNSNWCIFDNFKLEYYGTVVKVSSITIKSIGRAINQGESYQLQATILPANATIKSITWTSNDETIATVDENGIVTGVSTGIVTITATSNDESNVSQSIAIKVVNDAASKENIVINEIMPANVDMFLDPSTNFGGWMELYNPQTNTASINGFYLSDDPNNLKKWKMPSNMGVVPAKGYRVIWFDHSDMVQTNATFKLDCDGGSIYISDAEGNLLASQDYPAAIGRVSYARTTDGGDAWGYTYQPTIEATNNTSAFATQQLADPVVDKDGQLYSGTMTVCVNIPEGATLRYTVDGSTPTLENGETSETGLFELDGYSTNYRFRLYKDGYLPSNVVTRSYIQNEYDFTLPIISITTDYDFLFDDEIGCYVKGTNGRPGNGQSTACNWNMDWERPVNFEYISTENKQLINQDVNFSMAGGWSRAWTPHSFKLKSSKVYGINYLPYMFFESKPYIRNKALQIRNGGNDTNCRIKDASLANLIQTAGFDIDGQAYQPIVHYINGGYIGLLNMRETNNKQYVYANYGWDDDEIDQFEIGPDSGYCQKCGTEDAFLEWYDLSKYAADKETYELIKTKIDIDEYINYMATEFYLGSNDWPQNNVKGFRNINDGKFRFVIFDLDGAFANNSPFTAFANKQHYTFDLLYPSRERIYDEIKFVTIFLNMLQNAEFKKKFIDTFCIVGGSVFEPTRVNEIVTAMADRVRPMMALEGRSPDNTANNVKSNLSGRLNTMISAIKNYVNFGVDQSMQRKIKLSAQDDVCNLMINDMKVPTNAFDGYLFTPAKITAVIPAGYVFDGWAYANTSTSNLFSFGDTWKYYDKGSLDVPNWKATGYDDSEWASGAAPLGFSTNNVHNLTTTLSYGGDPSNKYPTYYFRKELNLEKQPSASDVFKFHASVDDGIVVYVNGTEAGRYNMPSGDVTFNSFSSAYAAGNPDNTTINIPAEMFVKGKNVIAVEVHNCDAQSTDILFDARLESTMASGDADYYTTSNEFTLPDDDGLELVARYSPMTEEQKAKQGFTPVRVNEVSAANSIYINEFFKRNDWVELYNTTDTDIDVEGMYLSDNSDKPQKYQITKGATAASTIIPAHGYLIIWCDKLEPASQLHASFKLAAEGGDVLLSDKDMTWTDKLSYPAHNGDMTVGRYPDGGKNIYVMNIPTIEKANVLSSYTEKFNPENPSSNVNNILISDNNGMRISYSAGRIAISNDEDIQVAVDIYTVSGQKVYSSTAQTTLGRTELSVGNLPNGTYIAKAVDAEGNRVACKFVVK